ncbi:hypothetical protein EDD18DRAFT_1122489 [Armillaria luteobubalina]|uniref:Inner centromere protein ARK-binding domain-containing protein n=1 Tax=Armillaria luteobubalina TaxID=153913 RepID=A0AA39UWJ7_9AGAR|nr:hypothetical protein EDD18DRAFT_1122489 [Armillaria luteobubalina]
MSQAGLLKWGNDIRQSMANDPGRQFFRDQIQMHGFLFLDDYLDNILAGARQDALIDLVKTPSRKKAVSKQPRTASKLKNVVAVLFNDDGDKENTSPTKSKSPDRRVDENISPRPPLGLQAVTPPTVADQTIPRTNPFQGYQAEAVLPNELSVIAEDEEPAEKSQKLATFTEPEPADTDINACLSHTSDNTSQTGSTSASADTFHSIILDSPSLDDAPPLSRLCSPPPPPLPVPDLPDQPVLESVEAQTYPPAAGSTAEPYGEAAESEFGQEGTDQDISPAEVSQQHSAVSRFPSLPAPVPLHKSLRGMEQQLPAMNPITPGAALDGKRTSWLKKAREAKALDGGGRKPGSIPLVDAGSHNTLKRKSSEFFSGTLIEPSGERHKVAKSTETDIAPLQLRKDSLDDDVSENNMPTQSSEGPSLGTTGKSEDMLGQFKKTIEGFRTRVGQSIGKSLAGAAAVTLAEARAAAEARVVEKNSQQEDDTQALGPVTTTKDPSHLDIQGSLTPTPVETAPSVIEPTTSTRTGERLSISELVSTSEKTAAFKEKIHASVFQPPSATTISSHAVHNSSGAPSSSVSTTHRPLPVFSKAQPVFRPPSPKPVFKARPPGVKSTAFSTPASMSLVFNPLSAQSTMESLAPDAIFDSQSDRTSWLPSTQDTEYDNVFDSPFQKHIEVLDEDDSWPMDEKLAEGVEWTFGVPFDREDSLTWSSAPTQSQKLEKLDHVSDDVPASAVPDDTCDLPMNEPEVPKPFCMEIEDYGEHDEAAVEEEEPDIDPGKMTVTLVEPERSQSQLSLASSASSQSHVGFLGQASKLMSSVLGTGKKPKPEVKSLQRAAAAAKKEQEERDKKTAVLKNMENRRQLVLQKKAEEEKARAVEQEKRLKEEADRRKREREEHTDKRPLKPTVKKDEDTTKKRKLAVESDKKPEIKKPMLKLNSGNSKSAFKPAPKPVPAAEGKGKLMSKFNAQTPSKALMLDDVSQPSQLLHSQMAARAKAQIEAAAVPSESIELPDVPSEYSDSDDEDRKMKKADELPLWAQSPELRQALENQATINPDDIFGPVPVLRMEEVFRTRASRFRARTSSANWVGADRLTQEEQTDYVRRMGYKS